MKLSKREAFEVYVNLYCKSSNHDYDVNDLLERMKEYVLGDELDEASCANCEGCSSEDEDDEEEDHLLDDDEDDEDEDEDDDPEYDETIDDVTLVNLPRCSTVIDGKPSKVSFELVDGRLDLLSGKDDRIDDVRFINRTGTLLSVYSDDGWFDFTVKKFPKEWTTLLETDTVYAVSEG